MELFTFRGGKMINFRYVFHLLECGHFCINYILKKEGIVNKEDYEKKMMSMYDIKEVLKRYFNNVNCYKIRSLKGVKTPFITLVLTKTKSFHYVVVERINSDIVYYYDPLFWKLKKTNINKFIKRWTNFCCFYSSK